MVRMKQVLRHFWDQGESQALALQEKLAALVVTQDSSDHRVRVIAGVDVSYQVENGTALAAIALFRADEETPFATHTASVTTRFPYIPGLFAFWELPAICAALESCEEEIDLIICDGHGIAHPRRFGLASHLGVLFEVPTIGCAKQPYIRDFQQPGPARGARTDVFDGPDIIGACVRTQNDTKPVFVSAGHRISLNRACEWVLRLASRYRLPEPIRAADHLTRHKPLAV